MLNHVVLRYLTSAGKLFLYLWYKYEFNITQKKYIHLIENNGITFNHLCVRSIATINIVKEKIILYSKSKTLDPKRLILNQTFSVVKLNVCTQEQQNILSVNF